MIIIEGVVVSGDQCGRELGFPTANLSVPDWAVPGLQGTEGVWAGVVACADGSRWLSAVSIGRRPTFYDERGQFLVEAHLLDFSGDLYGTTVEITLHEFLRGQLKFSSVEDLVACMRLDVLRVRRLSVVP